MFNGIADGERSCLQSLVTPPRRLDRPYGFVRHLRLRASQEFSGQGILPALAEAVKWYPAQLSTRNRNVPVLNEIEMSPGAGRWTLCETRLCVLQGAVGASARPRGRQRPRASSWPRQLGGLLLTLDVPAAPRVISARPAGTSPGPDPRHGDLRLGGRRRNLGPAHQAPPIANLDRAGDRLPHQHRTPGRRLV